MSSPDLIVVCERIADFVREGARKMWREPKMGSEFSNRAEDVKPLTESEFERMWKQVLMQWSFADSDPPMGWIKIDDDGAIRIVRTDQLFKLDPATGEITALPDGDVAPTTPETDLDSAQKRVSEIMGDFDKGLIRKPDAIRVRDRAARAVKDMDGYKGFGKRYGEEGYGEN